MKSINIVQITAMVAIMPTITNAKYDFEFTGAYARSDGSAFDEHLLAATTRYYFDGIDFSSSIPYEEVRLFEHLSSVGFSYAYGESGENGLELDSNFVEIFYEFARPDLAHRFELSYSWFQEDLSIGINSADFESHALGVQYGYYFSDSLLISAGLDYLWVDASINGAGGVTGDFDSDSVIGLIMFDYLYDFGTGAWMSFNGGYEYTYVNEKNRADTDNHSLRGGATYYFNKKTSLGATLSIDRPGQNLPDSETLIFAATHYFFESFAVELSAQNEFRTGTDVKAYLGAFKILF